MSNSGSDSLVDESVSVVAEESQESSQLCSSDTSLLSAIAKVWQSSETLCELVPFDRVFTDRTPRGAMPYVSFIQAEPSLVMRSDKTRLYHVSGTFHIWVDASNLACGEEISQAISDAYGELCFAYAPGRRVNDIFDYGPARPTKVKRATIPQWELVHRICIVVEYDRVQQSPCCSVSGDAGSQSTTS